MIRKTDTVYVPGLRGGQGTVEIRHILSSDELMGHGTMYAHVILPPHASLGYHQHVGNTEPYYVLKGNGILWITTGPEQKFTPAMSVSLRWGRVMPLKIRLRSRWKSWLW